MNIRVTESIFELIRSSHSIHPPPIFVLFFTIFFCHFFPFSPHPSLQLPPWACRKKYAQNNQHIHPTKPKTKTNNISPYPCIFLRQVCKRWFCDVVGSRRRWW